MREKIGRNELCPCRSGKKFKKCCLYKDEYELIRETVSYCKYDKDISDILCNLLNYMKENKWIGACHATSAILFIILSEFGYTAKLCAGEVKFSNYSFSHSWIKIDNKIIDLAISMPLNNGIIVSEYNCIGFEY